MITEQKFEMRRCNKVAVHLKKEFESLKLNIDELDISENIINDYAIDGFVKSISFEIPYTKRIRTESFSKLPNYSENAQNYVVFEELEDLLHNISRTHLNKKNKEGFLYLLNETKLKELSESNINKKDFYDKLSEYLDVEYSKLINELESKSIINSKVAWLSIRGFLRQINFDVKLMQNTMKSKISEKDFKLYFIKLNKFMDKIENKEKSYNFEEVFPDYERSLSL